jgi:hypothetical protein
LPFRKAGARTPTRASEQPKHVHERTSPEKRIAANLPIPEYPPIHPEEDPNSSDPDEIPVDFLVAIHDLGDEHDLHVESISVDQR